MRLFKQVSFGIKYLAFLIVFPLISTETIKTDDYTYYLDCPETSNFPLVILIPGSQKKSTRPFHQYIAKLFKEKNIALITLEKGGIDQKSMDEDVFEKKLPIDTRAQDHRSMLNNLKINGWNKILGILGQGDGGRIGAKIAQEREVSALVLLGSGGAWPPMEEVLHSYRVEMAETGFDPQYTQGFLCGARDEFAQALEHPTIYRRTFGKTHQYWASFLKTNLLSDLGELKSSIHIIAASEDNVVPLKSVQALHKALPKSSYVEKKGDRSCLHQATVFFEAIEWLEKNLSKKKSNDSGV